MSLNMELLTESEIEYMFEIENIVQFGIFNIVENGSKLNVHRIKWLLAISGNSITIEDSQLCYLRSS